MTLAIELTAPGGVENLKTIHKDPGDPGPGEIRLRQQGAGVNFIDIYQRQGLYKLPMPAILGVEGAGVVEAVGENVEDFSAGDRVAYAGLPGGYAEQRLLPAWRAVKLPPSLSIATAASSFLRAFTTHMLLHALYPVTRGTTLLVHAGAGGLASILVPWAKSLGARVIATASSEAKAERARDHGADQVIMARNADIAQAVRDWTSGKGVDLTIDGIGGPTFEASLNATAKFGTLASIGQAGGAIRHMSAEDFGPMRSLSFSRPSVMAYLADPVVYKAAAPQVVRALQASPENAGGPRFALKDAADAQKALEDGRTQGAPLLII